MPFNRKIFDIEKRKSEYYKIVNSQLGRRSEFEITIKALKALFAYVHGIRQAANITNQQLSQDAKDGLQYLQDIAQFLQDIKAAKEQLDSDVTVIEATVYPEEGEP